MCRARLGSVRSEFGGGGERDAWPSSHPALRPCETEPMAAVTLLSLPSPPRCCRFDSPAAQFCRRFHARAHCQLAQPRGYHFALAYLKLNKIVVSGFTDTRQSRNALQIRLNTFPTSLITSHTQTRARAHTHTHTQIHTHARAHTHTHTQMFGLLWLDPILITNRDTWPALPNRIRPVGPARTWNVDSHPP